MNRKTLTRMLDAALTHHKAGEHDQAARLYAQVCAELPKLYDGWYLAGALAFQTGRLEDAVTMLARALRLSPGASQCQLFLGMALADLGRFAEAEKPLRAGLAKHPAYPEAWENLADTLCALDRPAESAGCLRRVLALQPDRTEIRERLEALAVATV